METMLGSKRRPAVVDLAKDPVVTGSFTKSTTLCANGHAGIVACVQTSWRLIWSLVILTAVHPIVSFAQESAAFQSEFRILSSDGGWIQGQLTSPKADGAIAVKSHWFSGPLEFPVGRVLECLPADGDRLIDPVENTMPSFAFLLASGERYVGELLEWEKDRVIVSTKAMGQVEFKADQLVELFDSKLLTARLFSIERSVWRWDFGESREGGWTIAQRSVKQQLAEQRHLVCLGARRAIVGSLDLPTRFRMQLEVTCDASPDFELALGDRHEDVLENLSRRGGSRPQLPGERLVTKLEWFDQTVSLVRSNGSVADSVVFQQPRTSESNDADDPQENKLDLELFCDQLRGCLAAYCDGRLVGEANLTDDRPAVRERLTMINRGAAVRVRRLDLFEWDGELPDQAGVLVDAAELKDGSRVNGVSETQFSKGEFRFDDQSVSADRLLRLRTAAISSSGTFQESDVSVDESRGGQGRGGQGRVEILTRDGCRVSGLIVHEKDWDSVQGSLPRSVSGLARLRLRLTNGKERSILTREIRRIIGAASQVDRPTGGSLLQASSDSESSDSESSVSLLGRLVAGEGASSSFGWRANSAASAVGIAEGAAGTGAVAEVLRLQGGGSDTARSDLLSFRNGDQLAGRVIAVTVQGVEMQSVVAGTVVVPHSSIRTLELAGTTGRVQKVLDENAIAKLLVVPRRVEDDPPTHVLIAANGDAVRGRLISLEDENANFELRSRARVIERSKIVMIVWLSGSTVVAEPVDQWIYTGQGDQLGLLRSRFDGTTLVGEHRVLGKCRIDKSTITRLRFGDRDERPDDRWRLVPAKQPRSFDEPLESSGKTR